MTLAWSGPGRTLVGGCLVLFGLPFVGVGLLALGLFGKQLIDQRSAAGWEQVPARIESVILNESSDDESTAYSVDCRYSYEYAGRRYTGTRVSPDLGGSSDVRHQERFAILEEHRSSGRPFPAWVNPARPEESLLFREMTPLSWVLLPFGICFFAAGVFVMVKGVRDGRAGRRRARGLAEQPGRPWRADKRWAEGFVFDSRAGARLAGQWTGAVFMAIFIGMFVFVVLTQSAPIFAMVIVGIFVLVALWLLGSSAYQTLQFRKYGSPRLAMVELPAVPGRTLTAIVLCRRHVDVEGSFRVVLRCVQTVGSGKESRIETLHEAVVEVPHDRDLARERSGTAIPVEMPIPERLPPIGEPDEIPAIKWTLTVKAATPGVDFKAEFDLPVFRVENEALIERRPARE